MRFRYALTVVLSLLVAQMAPGDRANIAAGMTAMTQMTEGMGMESAHKRTVVVHRLDFEPETFRVSPEATPVLDEAIELLGESEPILVVIDQSIDTDRGQTFRLYTARRQAKAVRRYLVDHGIDPSRVSLPPVAVAAPPGDHTVHSNSVELHVQ